ncbi:MAG TPA: NAD(P)H-dependent oxidoreductase [Armatimonadota bacterium]|nr:NAD(P)H-dependent oxidoreductase [Armatimonadota bacterium]
MASQIVIIQGHPDPIGHHFGHALAAAYAAGAEEAGREVRTIDVAHLEFPLLRSKEDFEQGDPPEAIRQAQETVCWAEHLVILYPLWLGGMPALLKGFLEQLFRPAFVTGDPHFAGSTARVLKGRTAHIVVTMGMPALAYRWFYGAHSLKSLERNILGFCGIGPIQHTLIGAVEAADEPGREEWLEKLRQFGRDGK